MSVLNTLPAPVIQMGLVEKIVETAQNQPHVQQLINQDFTQKALKAQSEQVPEVTSTEHGRRVREREGGQEGNQGQSQEERQAAKQGAQEGDGDDRGPNKANPWSGHIVSVKI